LHGGDQQADQDGDDGDDDQKFNEGETASAHGKISMEERNPEGRGIGQRKDCARRSLDLAGIAQGLAPSESVQMGTTSARMVK
jgi:hypothetical protein